MLIFNLALGSWADEMEDMPMPGKPLRHPPWLLDTDLFSPRSQYAICFPSHVDDTFEVETDYFKALVLTMV